MVSVSSGRSASFTSTCRGLLSRITSSFTVWPGGMAPTSRVSWFPSVTGLPLSETTTSPGLTPALSAGLPFTTSAMSAPCVDLRPSVSTMSWVIGCGCTPRNPRITRPFFSSCGRICFTTAMGMANPIVFAPPMMAVLTPITSPRRLKSGPPELPGLIDASVCRKSLYTELGPSARSLALMIPEVTVACRPNGSPIATT